MHFLTLSPKMPIPSTSDYDSLGSYLEDIASFPLLSKDEETSLFLSLKTDPSSRTKIINANLRLVVWCAQKFTNSGVSLQDLISEGNIGLMTSIDKYMPERGAFSTHANNWINQRIRRYISNHSQTIREPEYVFVARKRINSFIWDFIGTHAREPLPHEIATSLGISKKRVANILKTQVTTVSIHSLQHDSSPMDEIQFSDPITASPDVAVDRKDLAQAINDLIDTVLTAREQHVVRQRHEFHGEGAKSFSDIGINIGRLTSEGARLIQGRAFGKLRKALVRSYPDYCAAYNGLSQKAT
jgi:RNA polymerase sigma factor (sigma-70 family)